MMKEIWVVQEMEAGAAQLTSCMSSQENLLMTLGTTGIVAHDLPSKLFLFLNLSKEVGD